MGKLHANYFQRTEKSKWKKYNRMKKMKKKNMDEKFRNE
jgi:hypothetical protein